MQKLLQAIQHVRAGNKPAAVEALAKARTIEADLTIFARGFSLVRDEPVMSMFQAWQLLHSYYNGTLAAVAD